jgi:hypothetical protein
MNTHDTLLNSLGDQKGFVKGIRELVVTRYYREDKGGFTIAAGKRVCFPSLEIYIQAPIGDGGLGYTVAAVYTNVIEIDPVLCEQLTLLIAEEGAETAKAKGITQTILEKNQSTPAPIRNALKDKRTNPALHEARMKLVSQGNKMSIEEVKERRKSMREERRTKPQKFSLSIAFNGTAGDLVSKILTHDSLGLDFLTEVANTIDGGSRAV